MPLNNFNELRSRLYCLYFLQGVNVIALIRIANKEPFFK